MLEQVFFILIVAIFFISIFYDEKQLKELKWMRFFNILSTFSIALVVYSNYVSTSFFRLNSERTEEQRASEFNKKYWIQFNNEITTVYSKIPSFCDSILKTINDENVTKIQEEDKQENYLLKRNIALLIFQSWEEFLFIFRQNTNGIYEKWVTVFIDFAKSKELYEIWKKERRFYKKITQEFGNKLFEREITTRDIDDKTLLNEIINEVIPKIEKEINSGKENFIPDFIKNFIKKVTDLFK